MNGRQKCEVCLLTCLIWCKTYDVVNCELQFMVTNSYPAKSLTTLFTNRLMRKVNKLLRCFLAE